MARICHAHCPPSGSRWLTWAFLGAVAAAVYAVAQSLIWAGKPVLTAILGGSLILVASVIVLGIRGSVRSARGAEPARTSAPQRVTEPARPDETTEPDVPVSTPGRTPLRVVSRDGRRVA